MTHLLTLGHGYSAQALAGRLRAAGWEVSGTTRDPAMAGRMAAAGMTPILLPADPADMAEALARASHILVSAAPDESGDPFLRGDNFRLNPQNGATRAEAAAMLHRFFTR